MSAHVHAAAWRTRLFCAVGIVIVLGAVLSFLAPGAQQSDARYRAETTGLSGTEAAVPEGVAEKFMLLCNAEPFESDIPQAFVDEVYESSPARAYCADEGYVVGIETDMSAQRTFADVEERMLRKGWVAVGERRETEASFMKKEGVYRWAYVQCTQIAGTTTTVFVMA